MTNQFTNIINFIVNAFISIWPYLLITIPLSVAIKMTGASKYINRALSKRPFISIFLATFVGAFSPFCSCGVIPVIATLLIGGVPLAPVMSFWIASPSMDPEIFFLSVATIGWDLAIWRLASTLGLSLIAGFITYYLMKKRVLGDKILQIKEPVTLKSIWTFTKLNLMRIKGLLYKLYSPALIPVRIMNLTNSSNISGLVKFNMEMSINKDVEQDFSTDSCYTPSEEKTKSQCSCGSSDSVSEKKMQTDNNYKKKTENENFVEVKAKQDFLKKLGKETLQATLMVIKFMLLAFFLEALIAFYIPQNWIAGLLGNQNSFSILWAALIGVPVYTSNLAALPLVGGLLSQGMNPAAALAFLISGPTTTIPAMAAVWGLTTRKVFIIYVAFAFFGAIFFGYLFNLINLLF